MAYNRGEYYKATMQAVNRLRTAPDNEKAITMVKKSYPMAIEYYRRQIDGIAASNTPDKFLKITDHYKKLNNLADEISRCPAALDAVKPVVYFDEQLAIAKDFATLKIVVEQLPDKNTNYEINTSEFYIQIYNSLVKQAPGEFVRYLPLATPTMQWEWCRPMLWFFRMN